MTSGAYRKIGYGEIVWREVNTATAIAKADQSATLAKENIESAVSDANQNLKKAVQKGEISSENFAEKADTKLDYTNITATVTTELGKLCTTPAGGAYQQKTRLI